MSLPLVASTRRALCPGVRSSTGEASAPEDYLWLMCRAGYKPVIEYCGGEGGSLSRPRLAAHSQLNEVLSLTACNPHSSQPHVAAAPLQPTAPACPASHPATAGTELGGGYFSGSLLQPQAPSTFSTPTIGHRPIVLVARPDGSQELSVHGDSAGARPPALLLLLLLCFEAGMTSKMLTYKPCNVRHTVALVGITVPLCVNLALVRAC